MQPAPGYLVRILGPGYFVGMTQPLRGLIPTLLDSQAAEPMVAGMRLQEESSSPNARCAQVVSTPFQAAIWSAGLNDYTSDSDGDDVGPRLQAAGGGDPGHVPGLRRASYGLRGLRITLARRTSEKVESRRRSGAIVLAVLAFPTEKGDR